MKVYAGILTIHFGNTYSIRTFEAVESPIAPYDGYVTGTADIPTVNIGDALVAICRLEIGKD